MKKLTAPVGLLTTLAALGLGANIPQVALADVAATTLPLAYTVSDEPRIERIHSRRRAHRHRAQRHRAHRHRAHRHHGHRHFGHGFRRGYGYYRPYRYGYYPRRYNGYGYHSRRYGGFRPYYGY